MNLSFFSDQYFSGRRKPRHTTKTPHLRNWPSPEPSTTRKSSQTTQKSKTSMAWKTQTTWIRKRSTRCGKRESGSGENGTARNWPILSGKKRTPYADRCVETTKRRPAKKATKKTALWPGKVPIWAATTRKTSTRASSSGITQTSRIWATTAGQQSTSGGSGGLSVLATL